MIKKILILIIITGGFSMSFCSEKKKFSNFLNSQGYFISAEFPYYRLEESLWKNRIELIKESGIETLTFYIPWNITETSKGLFDFQKAVKFLEMIRKNDMKAIIKPGPFICAEVQHGGIPDWVTDDDDNDEIIMKDSFNQDVRFRQDILPLPSYLSKEYLEYIRRWYEEVYENIINPFSDIISAIQVENEIPYSTSGLSNPFSWGYDKNTVNLYREWLREKYESIQKYNDLHQTENECFEGIVPPRGWKANDFNSWLIYSDWADFKSYYATKVLEEYVGILKDMEINIPFYHNYLMLEEESPVDFLKFNEIIYSGGNYWLPSHPLKDTWALIEGIRRIMMINASLGEKSYIPEMNWGWGTAEEFLFQAMYLLPYTNGFNVYPILDSSDAGDLHNKPYSNNPEPYPGMSPIANDGSKRKAYYWLETLVSFLKERGNELINAKQLPEVVIGYWNGYNNPRVYDKWGGVGALHIKQLFNDRIDLNQELNSICEDLYWSNISFSLSNLELDINCKKLIVVSHIYMPENIQKKLSEYVKKGGTLILIGQRPIYNEYFQSCNLIPEDISLYEDIKEINLKRDFQNNLRYEILHGQSSDFIFLINRSKEREFTLDYLDFEKMSHTIRIKLGSNTVSLIEVRDKEVVDAVLWNSDIIDIDGKKIKEKFRKIN